MTLMIKHHLVAGWRNILKYKTQNFISILCLSVGTVLFAVMAWLVDISWRGFVLGQFDTSTIEIGIERKIQNQAVVHMTQEDLAKVRKLSSVEDVIYKSLSMDANIRTKDSKKLTNNFSTAVYFVSSNWIERQDMCSALTGQRLKNLKKGSVLIVDRTRDRLFSKDFDPRGCEITNFTPCRRIDDVISTVNIFGRLEGIFVVDDETNPLNFITKFDYGMQDMDEKYLSTLPESEQEYYRSGKTKPLYCMNYQLSTLRIALKSGKTVEDFRKEANRVLAPAKVTFVEANDDFSSILLLYGVFIFLGSSILLIGLSGYLKMQMQLFVLRSREMALRRCNGAKSVHLFLLLCSELLLVFSFVLLLAIVLSVAIESYLMPKLFIFGIEDFLHLDMGHIFALEIWITLVTFGLSLVIAWFSVRRVMRIPLGKTAGKSYSQKTVWNGAMQVAQYFVATILLFYIVLVSTVLANQMNMSGRGHELSYYKNVICFRSYDCDELDKLPSAALVTRTMIMYEELSQEKADSIREKYGSVISPMVSFIDPAMLKLTNTSIEKDCPADKIFSEKMLNGKPEDKGYRYPVYALPEEVDAVRQQLGYNHTVGNGEMRQIGQQKFMCIGYIPLPDHLHSGVGGIITSVSKFIIRPHLDAASIEEIRSWKGISGGGVPSVLLLAKEGKFSALSDEIDQLSHERNHVPADVHQPIMTAYENWFPGLVIADLMVQFCMLLAFISLISIVLSVYSSVSLETRGRQKEVAIRKVNGAKSKDVVLLFSRYYVVTLTIAFALTAVVGLLAFVVLMMLPNGPKSSNEILDMVKFFVLPYLGSVVIIASVTFLTIWRKIHVVAHMNAAEMIKRE